MHLYPHSEPAPSNPPVEIAATSATVPACQQHACRGRRWRVCGRPGCSGLQVHPKQRGTTPNDSGGRADRRPEES